MKIKLLDFGYENRPKRAYVNDGGADVYAPEDYYLKSRETYAMGLKFGIEVPNGHMALVLPRSSLARKGITSELSPIDSGYRGEIHAIMHNQSSCAYMIRKGERIAQLVVLPVVIVDYVNNDEAERGNDGFGSTGKR